MGANYSARSEGLIWISFEFLNMKVCCVVSLESPHRGDSNYTQYTIFNIKKRITLNYSKSAAMGFCSKGLKNELETAVVNEPSVFEPRTFYCKLNRYTLCFLSILSHLLVSTGSFVVTLVSASASAMASKLDVVSCGGKVLSDELSCMQTRLGTLGNNFRDFLFAYLDEETL